MRKQNKLKRLEIFAKRYIKAKKMALLPEKIEGRKSGPKVLLNSIPKAGTNLLDGYLQKLPPLRPSGTRTIIEWKDIPDKTVNKILSIKKGQYYIAHIPAHEKLLSALRSSDIKVLLIVRDPRAVVVSNFKYVLDIDVTHRTHQYIKSLSNDRERLKACIVGKKSQNKDQKDILTPIDEIFKLFSGWTTLDNCLIIKFEDLVGERGGGNCNKQFETLKKIVDFLEINMSNNEINSIISKMENSSSPTLRSGKIDGWKKYFDANMTKIIENQLQDSAKVFGY